MPDTTIKVLLVDEDALERRALVRWVDTERLPYEITAVASLAAAGSMLARHAFDVVVIDPQVGGSVGTDLLPELIGTPAVALVRVGDEAIAARAIRAGAYGYVLRDAGRRYLALLPPIIGTVLARRHAEVAAATRSQELARTIAEFQRLASMMWHETMGPLTTLLGTAEMLQLDVEQDLSSIPADVRAMIKQTVETATQLERLVTDVLGFYRLQSAPMLVTVDLDAVLADVVATLPGSLWRDAVVDVAKLPTVTGDPARLRLLVRQLLDAAHRVRGPEPLVVRVWATVYDDAFRLSVSDNGIGMPPVDSDRFVRDDGCPPIDDVGLGRAVCRRIAEQHGGRIWYESQAKNGTTVHLTLPRVALLTMRTASAVPAQ